MGESWRTRLMRWGFNCVPAYAGTGARITYIADDWREVRINLALSWRTRNYVGTIYGGSMYGSVDPIYMIMLIKLLGPDYIVWDKAGSIVYRKPGRNRLTATFRLDDAELDTIKAALMDNRSVDREYSVDLIDADGVVCATVSKTIYVRRKEPAVSKH